MLYLGSKVACSTSKSMAADTAATASIKEVVVTGKSRKVADTSCHHMSQRDLAYFSSERFARLLALGRSPQALAMEYGRLIASRKRANQLSMAWQLVDCILYGEDDSILAAHRDGFTFSYEEVRDLFKGYRSQALRELKSSKGFNSLVYRELAKALADKAEVRFFLQAINRPVVREYLSF